MHRYIGLPLVLIDIEEIDTVHQQVCIEGPKNVGVNAPPKHKAHRKFVILTPGHFFITMLLNLGELGDH